MIDKAWRVCYICLAAVTEHAFICNTYLGQIEAALC